MKCKLFLSALSAALLFAGAAQAQIPGVSKVTKALPKVSLGIKVGTNMQQLNGGAGFDNAYKPGLLGGAFLSVRKNKIGVRAEALIKTAKIDATIGSSYVKMLGLDVPLMFEYGLVPRVWLQAGPQFNMLFSAKDNNGTDVKQYFNSSSVSAAAGVEVALPFHLTAGARYIYGLTKSGEVSYTDITGSIISRETLKSNAIQIYVGFRFL